jgi:hypothetical protein
VSGGVLLLEPLLAAVPPPLPDDVAVFAQEAAGAGIAISATPLDPLAIELGEAVEAACLSREDCTFDLDVPGFGRLEGRFSMRSGTADLELHALRPASAALLRGRQHELQRMVDRESGGDVNLFIV